MKRLIYGIIAITLYSCNNNSPEKNNNDSISVVNIDSTQSAIPDSLHFGTVLQEQKKSCKKAFQSIKTSKDFFAAYLQLCQLETDMNAEYENMPAIESPVELNDKTEQMMGSALPWILGELIAEGTIPISLINNIELQKTAKLTPETEDDQFTQFLVDAYGDMGSLKNGIPVWIEMNCDVCYYSTIGNGKSLKILKQIDALKNAQLPITANVDSIARDIIHSACHHSDYQSSLNDVMMELENITKEIVLLPKEHAMIDSFKKQCSDTTANDLQFNCNDGHCSF